ncbi:hypothetical protein P175DRAFT_0512272 [Aspergillus ochraceoroseus IBT 24754]|uniref:Uncharacterized protein n=2 Tax=Aspergillus ochraceoroseus TaxID=138278 RepID=A0A2T5LMQ3_9EURO|nr:uncharacterized protein P175DRAFT_0512272 [Aspergillus ochraceoroseus IBT 24754]KKK12095.1 hypothetical protein AOCH_000003 [Aspergillus ochraceoroseus]PTU17547.1 hypothetical protein P175DRAFT_0512272 [Aspergillus ochraceoroseus IBT 24754]
MEPLHSRISYASWRLRVFRQLFVPVIPSNSTFHLRRAYSSIPNDDAAQKASINSTSNHNGPPTNTARDGNEATSIPPSQLLPQSPLITHPYHAREIRHRKKRPATTEDLSDLRRNPWAMALASPVRLCTVTAARMPKALLTDWGMVEQTITSPSDPNFRDRKLWLLPVSLIQDELAPPSTDTQSADGTRKVSRPYLKMRMIDRMPILKTLTYWLHRTRERRKSPVTRLIPFRWKYPQGPVTGREETRLAWRGDMPDFVLKMMRRDVLKQLKRVSDQFKRQDVANGVWRSIDVQNGYSETSLLGALEAMDPFERMGSGVVLVLGEGNVHAPQADAEVEVGDDTPSLPDFVTLPLVKTKVPVLDLTQLLGPEELEDIRSYHSRFQKFAVFLRPTDQLTVDAVLALWKLKGYVRPG